MSTTTDIKKIALHLFAQKGYNGTALSEIADGVGIKKPSLYAHFDCKEDLFITVFKEVLDEYVQFIQTALEHMTEKATLEEKLRDILFSHCRYYKNNEEKTALMKRAMLFPPNELRESLHTEFLASELTMNQLLSGLFQQGVSNGDIRAESVNDLLTAYYCMIDGLFIQMFYYKETDFENKWLILAALEGLAWASTFFMLFARYKLNSRLGFKIGVFLTVITGVIPQVTLGIINFISTQKIDLFTLIIVLLIIYGATLGKKDVKRLDRWAKNKYSGSES